MCFIGGHCNVQCARVRCSVVGKCVAFYITMYYDRVLCIVVGNCVVWWGCV